MAIQKKAEKKVNLSKVNLTKPEKTSIKAPTVVPKASEIKDAKKPVLLKNGAAALYPFTCILCKRAEFFNRILNFFWEK